MLMEAYRPLCQVDGCQKHPSGRSVYCPIHNKNAYERGHPTQPRVFPYLKPYIQRVEMWTKTIEGSKALQTTLSLYEKHTKHHRDATADEHDTVYRTGVRSTSPQTEMSALITGVSITKDARKAVVQMIAYGLMWEEDPRSFRNDAAAICEAANIYLMGASMLSKSTYNKATGQFRTVPRYIKKATRNALGRWLMQHWVILGITLSREWNKKLALELREKRELTDLIKASA